MVFTDGISNNDDEMPKPILTQMKKKNKPSKGLVLNCDITELQDPQKSAFLDFFYCKKANLEYLINIVELHTVAP